MRITDAMNGADDGDTAAESYDLDIPAGVRLPRGGHPPHDPAYVQAIAQNTRDFGAPPRPVEWIIGLYLCAAALALVFFHAGVPSWPLHALTSLALGVAVLGLATRRREPLLALAWVRRVLPLISAPLLYSQTAALNDMFFPQMYFDEVVAQWEQWMFGQQMAIELRQMLPHIWVSEYLHFGYFAYYGIAAIFLVSIVLQRRWEDLEESFTAFSLVFVTCQMWFIAFPVAGPYHYFGPADYSQLGKIFPPLVHAVVAAGSSVGTAFPSSHCAVAGIIYIMALVKDPGRSGLILTFIVPALVLGTVYGGFHYAVDSVAGVLWAGLMAPLSIWIHRTLRGRARRARPLATGEA